MRAATVYDNTHECSAWLRGIEADRLADIDATVAMKGIDASAYEVIVVPLSGRTHPEGSREDRECDRCGRFVPIGQNIHLIIAQPRPGVRLVGGLCTRCKRLEVGV